MIVLCCEYQRAVLRNAQRPRHHLLDTDGEAAVVEPSLDHLTAQVDRVRARRARVGYVDDRDVMKPEPVQGALPGAAGVRELAHDRLLDDVLVDTRVRLYCFIGSKGNPSA